MNILNISDTLCKIYCVVHIVIGILFDSQSGGLFVFILVRSYVSSAVQ
jgi:hypothetical protein